MKRILYQMKATCAKNLGLLTVVPRRQQIIGAKHINWKCKLSDMHLSQTDAKKPDQGSASGSMLGPASHGIHPTAIIRCTCMKDCADMLVTYIHITPYILM